jgi:hypothetical protein
MSDTFAEAVPVTQQEDDREEWLVAWALVLLLLNANANRPLNPAQRRRARDLLRVKFEDDATRNAEAVTGGALAVSAWQAAMMGSITDYTRQMAVAGAGTMPNQTVQQAAIAEIQRQAPFLAGFAKAVAQGALSEGRIAHRAKMYGGSGWGMFYRAQGSTAGDGIVEQWISRDDRNVCSLCAPRHGRYYLPGQPPFPGACLGSCRCERIQVVDFQIWRRLMGR